MADLAAEKGYREFSFRLGDIAETLKPEYAESLPEGVREILVDFLEAAQSAGYGNTAFFRMTLAPDAQPISGIKQLTHTIIAYQNGETKPYVDKAPTEIEIKKILLDESGRLAGRGTQPDVKLPNKADIEKFMSKVNCL